ncbi:MAG: hypothetical protein Q6373_012930 [Candidatus Sigynarchaeota archaeon]
MSVCFQTKFKDDVQKLKGLLHLPEEKASFLEILPEHTCIIKLNSYPSPFILETRKPFITEPHTIGSTRKCKSGILKNQIDEKDFPRNFSDYSQFLAKVRNYCQLKDHAWNDFSTLSINEMKALESRVLSLYNEIKAIIQNNREIMLIVKNARKSRTPDLHLCKIHDELFME